MIWSSSSDKLHISVLMLQFPLILNTLQHALADKERAVSRQIRLTKQKDARDPTVVDKTGPSCKRDDLR